MTLISSLDAEVNGQGTEGYAVRLSSPRHELRLLPFLEQAQYQYCFQSLLLGKGDFQLKMELQHLSTASLAYGM